MSGYRCILEPAQHTWALILVLLLTGHVTLGKLASEKSAASLHMQMQTFVFIPTLLSLLIAYGVGKKQLTGDDFGFKIEEES